MTREGRHAGGGPSGASGRGARASAPQHPQGGRALGPLEGRHAGDASAPRAHLDDCEGWPCDCPESGRLCDCDGSGVILICPDDMCHGLGYCVHGDGEIDCPCGAAL